MHLEFFHFAFSVLGNIGIQPKAKWWRKNEVVCFGHQQFLTKLRWLSLVHFSGVGCIVHCFQDFRARQILLCGSLVHSDFQAI